MIAKQTLIPSALLLHNVAAWAPGDHVWGQIQYVAVVSVLISIGCVFGAVFVEAFSILVCEQGRDLGLVGGDVG